MGRGRAKAKQTKVARDLKYSSPSTDFGQLQRELSESDVDGSDPRDGGDRLSEESWNREDDWRR